MNFPELENPTFLPIKKNIYSGKVFITIIINELSRLGIFKYTSSEKYISISL